MARAVLEDVIEEPKAAYENEVSLKQVNSLSEEYLSASTIEDKLSGSFIIMLKPSTFQFPPALSLACLKDFLSFTAF